MNRTLLLLKSVSQKLSFLNHRNKLLFLLFTFSGFLSFSQTIILNDLKAFPTAEGYGKNATGGRGGAIIEVTNLNDSGSGSWRAALETPGPRIIIPKVSGTINLSSIIYVANGDVSIMGQAAPTGGTLFRNYGIYTQSSNIIMRNIRVRIGNVSVERDGILIWSDSNETISDIILDHVSVSWATDENISVVNASDNATTNVTIQNSMISEANYGMLLGGNNKNHQKFSILNNYFAHNSQRHPYAKSGGQFISETLEVANNIVYSYDYGVTVDMGGEFDVKNNLFKENPNDGQDGSATIVGILPYGSINSDETLTKAYISGNTIPSGLTEIHQNLGPYVVASPQTNSGYLITPTNDLPDKLLVHAGASLSGRDAVDNRVVADFYNETGVIDPAPSTYVFPTIQQNTGYVDANTDGIEDAWASEHNVSSADEVKSVYVIDGVTIQNNAGYTALDIFMAYLAGDFYRLAGAPYIDVTGVTVSPSTATINIPETISLTPSFQPADASDQSGTWSSSNIDIATVNASGVVTPVSEGEVVITFNTNSGGFSDSATITVTNIPIDVESVSLSPETLDLNINATSYIVATILPTNASNQTGTWSSSNTAVATVSQIGFVQPVSVGETVISFTTNEGDFTATSVVAVNDDRYGSYEFYNADTDNFIQSVEGGEILNLDNVGENLNFRIIPNGGDDNPEVESVGIEWDGIEDGIYGENAPLYAGMNQHFGNDYQPYTVQEGTYNFTVTYYTENGQTGDIVAVDHFSINFTRGSQVNAGVDTSICDGDTVTLTATGADSYLWDTGETTASIAVSPDTTTEYTVTGTHTNGTLTTTDSVVVTVNELPVINAGEDQTICEGDTITLTATTSVGSITWSNGQTTSSITVSPSDTTTYIATANNNGCLITDEILVNVNPAPNAYAGNDITILTGNSTVLNASGGDSYLWSTGETTESITVSPTSNTTYSVDVFNSNDCSDTDTVTVTVVGPVVANAGEDIAICEGESVTLTASGGDSYLWNTGETTQSITISPLNTTTYTVTVSDQFTTDSDEVIVTVNPAPIVSAGDDVTINEGDSVTLYASGGNSYLWSTGETNANISVSPSETTTYSVTTTINGCSDTDEVTVTVIQLVNAFAGDDQTICLGNELTLTASGGDTYVWNNGETTESITVAPESTSTYSVTVTNANGSDTDDVTVNVENCPAQDFEYRAYPNPTNGIINVRLAGLNSTSVIQVTDILGKQLKYIEVQPNSGQIINLQVDLTGMTKGFYLMTFYGDNRTITKKMVLR